MSEARPFSWRNAASGFRLVRTGGGNPQDEWTLSESRPSVLGRHDDPQAAPDIDLSPDRTVSRRHARIWFERDGWWIEDLDSRHGTLLGNRRLAVAERARCEPGSEVFIGKTGLMLFPPNWHRLRHERLAIEIALTPAVNYALVRAGTPIISRLVVRNWSHETSAGRRLVLSFAGVARTAVTIPPLAPGAACELPPPRFDLDRQALVRTLESSWQPLAVQLDGDVIGGRNLGCWLLAHNEWSLDPQHRLALAAFVLPNQPAVTQSALDALSGLGTDSTPESVLERLYMHFATEWHIDYRFEPPHYDSNSQKVRLADHVLVDIAGRRGHGTCLDLALLFAGCLESMRQHPLIALVDLQDSWHALVGCWRSPKPGLEPLLSDRERLLREALWIDPNACTQELRLRRPYAEAGEAAVRCLGEGPLVFALDIVAARGDGVLPLPFGSEPQWSQAVARVLVEAEAAAQQARAQLATVPLLIGLLAIEDGLAGRAAGAVDARGLARQLAAQLPGAETAVPASRHYVEALALARARARVEQSPLVYEHHLILALLDVRSAALDDALRWLGTDRQRLRSAVHALSAPLVQDDTNPSIFRGG
jgi:hypothetical protein